MRIPRRLLLLLCAVALVATGCGSKGTSGSNGTSSKGNVAVASAGFTESQVLAAMYRDLLKKAGFTVTLTDVKSSEIFQSSLEKGTINVVPEYVATYADQLNTIINGANAKSVSSPDLNASLAALKMLAAKRGLSVLEPTNAVDQNAFAVSKTYATKHNLTTLSDLGRSGLSVILAAGPECATRPFCAPGLGMTYGIKIKQISKLGVDTTQTKSAVQKGEAQLGLVLTTDGTLADFGLVALIDDKKLQNADYLVPVVNAATLKKHPEIATALNKLVGVLTTEDLASLNKKVDAERQTPADVASAYLKSKGLI